MTALVTGLGLLPVALSVGVMSVVGTKLAVRFGTPIWIEDLVRLVEPRTGGIAHARPFPFA